MLTSVKFGDFAVWFSTVQITFKLGTILTFEGALFSCVYGFSLIGLRRKLKKAGRRVAKENSRRSPSVGSFERPQRTGAIRGGCIQWQPTDNNEFVNSIQWRVRFSIEPH